MSFCRLPQQHGIAGHLFETIDTCLTQKTSVRSTAKAGSTALQVYFNRRRLERIISLVVGSTGIWKHWRRTHLHPSNVYTHGYVIIDVSTSCACFLLNIWKCTFWRTLNVNEQPEQSKVQSSTLNYREKYIFIKRQMIMHTTFINSHNRL